MIGEHEHDCEMQSQLKTRDLPLYDYFNKLQEEYIVAELRKKIYPKLKDKKYWDKVMQFKKKKIEDIVLRNCLNSIFNNEKVKEKLYLKVYNKTGLPNFLYKDDEDRFQTEILDKRYYYNEDSDFKVILSDDEMLVGKLVSVDLSTKKLVLIIDGSSKEFDISITSRIL